MERARVLLAEDHPAVAERLREMLKSEFDVIGIASNGNELLAATRVTRPDAIVADIVMPGLDGLQAAEILLKENPAARIVAISVHDDPALIKRAMDLGILGFVSKANGCADLVTAVKAALQEKKTVPIQSIRPPQSPERKTP